MRQERKSAFLADKMWYRTSSESRRTPFQIWEITKCIFVSFQALIEAENARNLKSDSWSQKTKCLTSLDSTELKVLKHHAPKWLNL